MSSKVTVPDGLKPVSRLFSSIELRSSSIAAKHNTHASAISEATSRLRSRAVCPDAEAVRASSARASLGSVAVRRKVATIPARVLAMSPAGSESSRTTR